MAGLQGASIRNIFNEVFPIDETHSQPKPTKNYQQNIINISPDTIAGYFKILMFWKNFIRPHLAIVALLLCDIKNPLFKL